MARRVRVFPVEGRYLIGVPAVEHLCDDPLCVESGAFTPQPPEAEPITPDPPTGGSVDSAED